MKWNWTFFVAFMLGWSYGELSSWIRRRGRAKRQPAPFDEAKEQEWYDGYPLPPWRVRRQENL